MKKLFLLIGLSVMTSLFGLTEAEVAIFQKSANQGDADAQYELGLCYGTGAGVSKNMNRAVYWWQKSANQGNLEAKKELETLGVQQELD